MWELDHKEGRVPKNRCLRTVVLEKIPESLLDSKEIKPVNLNENQPWIITGRTGAEAKAPVFWSSDGNRLIGKVPDAGKDWGQKEKKASEDEMAGWHLRCNEHTLGQASGDGEGQGDLVCCSPWGRKESDTTERLNWTRFVIAFLPRSNCFLISSLQSPSTVILEPKERKSVTTAFSPICHEVWGRMPRS